jgi:hypothetical protein
MFQTCTGYITITSLRQTGPAFTFWSAPVANAPNKSLSIDWLAAHSIYMNSLDSALNNTELLWTTGLVAWICHVLHRTRLYPTESFDTQQWHEIHTRLHRHPRVADYIKRTVSAAAAGLVHGLVDRVSLDIIDGDQQVLERYILDYSAVASDNPVSNNTQAHETLQVALKELAVCNIPCSTATQTLSSDTSFCVWFGQLQASSKTTPDSAGTVENKHKPPSSRTRITPIMYKSTRYFTIKCTRRRIVKAE